ncbi:ABC transporter permease [Sporosarcina sp. 179-K 8C2 HS]
MAKLLKLMQNEWMKLWHKKGTWIMVGILITITSGMMALMKWISTQNSNGMTRQGMIQDPSSLGGTVLLLTVIVAAGIVASEFSQGTIKMLLTRPVKRWKILLSKFLTVNLFGMFLMLIGYVVYILLALLLFKSGAGEGMSSWSVWSKSLYMLLLSFGSVFVTATFAFTIGSVFRSSSLAIGLSLFIYFTGSTISALLSQYEIAKYLLFTHMDLTQFETGMMLIPDLTMPFSFAVLAVYIVAFLGISFTTFVKRDVTA